MFNVTYNKPCMKLNKSIFLLATCYKIIKTLNKFCGQFFMKTYILISDPIQETCFEMHWLFIYYYFNISCVKA